MAVLMNNKEFIMDRLTEINTFVQKQGDYIGACENRAACEKAVGTLVVYPAHRQ